MTEVSATIGAARHAQHRRLRRHAHAPPAELREAAALLLRRDHLAAAGRSPLGFELEVLRYILVFQMLCVYLGRIDLIRTLSN